MFFLSMHMTSETDLWFFLLVLYIAMYTY